MICADCRAAASYAAQNPTEEDVTKAEALHSACRGGTWCACQHVVRAQVISPDTIES